MRRIDMKTLLGSSEHLSALRDLVADGGIVAIPTETFYGLAVDPGLSEAVSRLFAVKGRPSEKALPVLFAEEGDLDRLGVEASPAVRERFLRIWPAALTVIFSTRSPLACSGGDRSLAVRMPAHPGLRSLLRVTGPLTGTSANPSGSPALSDPNEVALAFGDSIDLLVDDGPCPGRRPSTLVDARLDPPRVLREGAYRFSPA